MSSYAVPINRELPEILSPEPASFIEGAVEIIDWTLERAKHPIITTNFRPLSIALVHLLYSRKPDVPVVWVDTGFNTAETYEFVTHITAKYSLNLWVYRTPALALDSSFRDGVFPEPDTGPHQQFTQQVKLDPFEKALDDFRPDYWFTGVRREQTAFRASLTPVSDGPRGITRVAPLLDWSEVDVETYIYDNELPDYSRYFDPTKGDETRECGLQTMN